MHAIKGLVVALMVFGIAGCDQKLVDMAPPRVNDVPPQPSQVSLIAVPINADIAPLKQALEKAVPRTLWSINKHERACIPPQRVKIFGKKIKATPPISCTIVGQVTRGALRLRGEGREIVVDMPLNARISAGDVGGVLKGKTATGAAIAHARIRIDLTSGWQMAGKARISYGWTQPPGIDFLGRRITFTDDANAKLAPVVRDVEREVNREIAKINIRRQAADIWRQSFAVLALNHENPPVWMRVSPKKILYGGYRINGQQIGLDLGLEAITETFVGDRPSASAATALPPARHQAPGSQLKIFVPVIADYAELEPVILRALVKRSAQPFDLPSIGSITAKFDKVVTYGTTGGKIAVGITMEAKAERMGKKPTRGIIWITAMPVNAANSAQVQFTDIAVTGDTNGMGGDLLLLLARSDRFAPMISDALTQNFTHDLEELQGKIRNAIDQRRQGAFMIRTHVDKFETGEIKAYGNGLYLPIRMVGSAKVDYRPKR